ncbi:MAG: hypothetical protein ACYCXF_09015 [Thermoleophilia bacterium]
MQKTVKFTSETPATVCKEKLPGCDVKTGIVHVCFEDGTGESVCRNCLAKLADEGRWITDSSVSITAA